MDLTEPFVLSPALKDFISGAVAGAFAITVSQPLDTVRVRLQQATHGSGPSRNAFSVLLTMVRTEGALSPFKGLTYPLLFASVQSAILFQAYGWTLRQLASSQEQHQPQQHQQRHPEAQAASSSFGSTSTARLPPAGASPTAVASITATAPLSPSTSPALHQLHLHHHHHLQQQQQAAVHGSASYSGQLLAWVAARLAETNAAGGAAASGSPALTAHSGGTGAGAVGSGSSSLHRQGACGSSDSGVRGGGDCSGGVTAAGEGSASRSPVAGAGGVEGGSAAASTQRTPHPQQRQQVQQAALPTPWHGFLAGSVSGFAQVFLWSPVELLKLRAQLQTATPGSSGYRNPAAMAKHVLRQDGIAGLYRGFTLTVIRDVPSYAMYFWLYHDIAGALSPGVHPEQAPPSTQVLAGGLAGVIAWLPIYPLDVLKSRVQAVTSCASRGKTWVDFAREMYREAGTRAFFRGVAPTLVRAFLMDGASFLGYTTTLKALGGSGSREAVAVVPMAPAAAPAAA